jgi:two-component system chemotaxis response regulator CheB
MSATKHNRSEFDAVVVGTSAGGVEALLKIFPVLTPAFRLPIFTVIHLPPDSNGGIAALVGSKSQLPVKEAEDKEPIAPGTIYFAPPNYHLLIEPNHHLSLSSDEPVLYSRPSIDVLFESAADVFGDRLLGIVLTGASSDGAKGMQKLCEAGGTGLVERPDQAYVATMPRSAAEACSNARKLSLAEIAASLQQLEDPKE